ncbi:hypothetical protein [Nocardioides daeguensis]|uniref:Septum formation initiator n=1 Tax=Nocardioides daeguensis TaxID=908359 RepID=A0ABP6W5R6_9ACTN|nr:hypothetical protein [Nocardioides daeguensis]MBV6727670.1 hypothetical protein [Nocardioides daeguensis]MCR1775142.1 hypothetical protein [Nocardioides daeguensis]
MRLSRTGLGRLGLGLVAWAIIVVLGSWLVWLVVSDAGRDVAGSTIPRGTVPSAGPAPSTSPRPTPTAAPSGDADQVTRTWTGSAGVVTTRCAGGTIALAGAAASSDGYVVEVKSRGPREVDVEFEGRGEETVLDTRVRARCVDGTPHYQVDAED